MSLIYPIAKSAMDALLNPLGEERTRSDASELAGESVWLDTEWLEQTDDWSAELVSAVQAAISQGAAQVYENAKGQSVIALSFWHIGPAPAPKPVVVAKPAEPAPAEEKKVDHTDDLYFRRGRTKPRNKKRLSDPNQLDLFAAPEGSDDA